MLAFDGYIRVSQVAGRSGPSFISPEVQRDQITSWARGRGVEIAQWHEDLDWMGSLTSRPGYDLAMQRALAGQTRGIVVANLGRWFRNLSSGLDAIKRLHDAEREFISVREGIDPTTPTGMLQLQLMLAFYEFERAQSEANWSTAREKAIGRGVHIASTTPYGYVRGADGKLVVDEKAAAIVVAAFKARARGQSMESIVRLLDELGAVSPKHGYPFTNGMVRPMIANRVYLGEARHGEFVNAHAHPPIVDKALFEKAQSAPSMSTGRSHRERLLLTGVARCAGCQYTLQPGTVTTPAGREVRTYGCRRKHTAGRCESPATISAHLLDEAFELEFFKLVEGLRAAGAADSAPLAAAEKAHAEALAELEAYRDDSRILGALGPDRFVAGLEKRVADADRLETELHKLRAQQPLADLPSDIVLEDVWTSLNVEQKHELVRSCIGAVFLSKGRRPAAERMIVVPLGLEPPGLPTRGSKNHFVPTPYVGPAG